MEKSTLTKKKTSISVSQEKELLMFPKCKTAKGKKKKQKRRERNEKSERIGESSGKAKEREKKRTIKYRNGCDRVRIVRTTGGCKGRSNAVGG